MEKIEQKGIYALPVKEQMEIRKAEFKAKKTAEAQQKKKTEGLVEQLRARRLAAQAKAEAREAAEKNKIVEARLAGFQRAFRERRAANAEKSELERLQEGAEARRQESEAKANERRIAAEKAKQKRRAERDREIDEIKANMNNDEKRQFNEAIQAGDRMGALKIFDMSEIRQGMGKARIAKLRLEMAAKKAAAGGGGGKD